MVAIGDTLVRVMERKVKRSLMKKIVKRSLMKRRKWANPKRFYSETPLLMVLADHQEESRNDDDSDSVFFFTAQGQRLHDIKNRELCSSLCVGSSHGHGWLELLDQSADPYLLHPFSGRRILLPAKQYLPHVKSVSGSHEDYFEIQYSHGDHPFPVTAKALQYSLIVKAVLSSDPEENNYAVIAIYGYESKLAYFGHGGTSWTDLNGEHGPYSDIICLNNKLFALSDKGLIEAWDLGGRFPEKSMDLHPRFPTKVRENTQYCDSFRFSSKFYLVESSGHLLFVVRYIGEFVGEDGMAVCEADLITDEDSQPLVCPYKTVEFQVFKLSFCPLKWEEVETLGDRALFLGGNHSVSLSIPVRDSAHYKKNSIYFTDDYWDRLNEDSQYGGHDVGVFSLEDKTVETLNHCGAQRMEPPPVWVV